MSLKVTIEVEGLDDLQRAAASAGANADPVIHGALVNSTNKIQSLARARAPHRTGTLQRSIMPEVSGLDALVAVNEKYGVYIEEGTGIYGPMHRPITPKVKKVLVFRINGKKIVTKSIKGMRARPFFGPAIDQAAPYIQQQFDKVADVLITALAKGR